MKKIFGMLMATVMLFSTVGCSASTTNNDPTIQGDLIDVTREIYQKAELSEDTYINIEWITTQELTEDNAKNYIGDVDFKFTQGVVSSPGMSSIAYELVLLNLEEGEDVEAAKEQIKANANPRKWICVEAEKVVVENIGNTIFFLMASNEDAESITKSFNSLAETK